MATKRKNVTETDTTKRKREGGECKTENDFDKQKTLSESQQKNLSVYDQTSLSFNPEVEILENENDEAAWVELRKTLKDEMIKQCTKRGSLKTCCPSEIARKVDPHKWRELMEPVRDVAKCLANEGKIHICQRNEVIDHNKIWTGPIRLRIANSSKLSSFGFHQQSSVT